MPRLLINGFPKSLKSCFHIRVNAAGKGTGAQPKILFDRTIQPTDDIYELAFENIYLGSTIRLEVNVPGFIIIDKNIQLHTNKGYTSLLLIKLKEPDLVQLAGCYGSFENWQALQCNALNTTGKQQFKQIIAAERRQERNTLLAALFIVLLIAAVIYVLFGPVGLLVVLIFGFYYREKSKHNKWADVT